MKNANSKRKVSKTPSTKDQILNSSNTQAENKAMDNKSYRDQLLEVNKNEADYDKIFQNKLEAQYREFRALKEHRLQIKKFISALTVIAIIIFVTLLALIYGG